MNEGALIAGKYRLESLLGRGGMGAVWRALDIDLRAPVAVKLLDPLLAASAEGLSRFHREAEAAASLRSPHVVQIIARGVDDVTHQPFIVMELMEGESLATRLEREGTLSPAQTAGVLTQVARALTRAHEAGVVHRDLKPDNIFLVRNEEEELAKVLDFGIAKSERHRLGNDSDTRTGAVMGTPYYMSPEQISSSKGVDFRADLWALGVIACECLTGRRPFEDETYGGLAVKICALPIPRPSELGAVPPAFDAWFARAVSRDAAARFGSAREAAEELRRACGETVTSSPPVASAPRPPTVMHPISTAALSRTTIGAPSRPGPLALALGITGVVAAVAGVAFWLTRPPAPEAASTGVASVHSPAAGDSAPIAATSQPATSAAAPAASADSALATTPTAPVDSASEPAAAKPEKGTSSKAPAGKKTKSTATQTPSDQKPTPATTTKPKPDPTGSRK